MLALTKKVLNVCKIYLDSMILLNEMVYTISVILPMNKLELNMKNKEQSIQLAACIFVPTRKN